MNDPTRLQITVGHADGSTDRWAEDEVEAADIPEGLTISTSIPGGDKSAVCTLPRKTRRNDDLTLFDSIEIFGPGKLFAFRGYQSEFPWQAGSDSSQVSVEALGWAAAFGWGLFSEIYIDRDLTHWVEPSRARRANLFAGGMQTIDGPTLLADAGGTPAVELRFHDKSGANFTVIGEAWYDAGPGAKAASSYYDWAVQIWGGGATVTTRIGAATDDAAGGSETSGDLTGTATGTGTFTPSVPKRYLFIQWHNETTLSGDVADYTIHFRRLAPVGDHDLTKQGTEPDAGFLISDVIRNIVSRSQAPIAIDEDQFTATGWICPHLEFREPVTPNDAVLRANAFELYDWGVYENGFFYRPPTEYRKRWRARLDEGAELSHAGETAEETYESVIVTYTDESGTSRTYGPPGSGSDLEDASLQVTDETNLLVAHGYTKPYSLELGPPTTAAGALKLGQTFLERASQPSLRGEVSLFGMVRDDAGNEYPAWYVKAGDSVTIEDELDGEVGPERRIVETTYSHAARQVSCSTDSLPSRLDAVIEQMGAVLVGAIGS